MSCTPFHPHRLPRVMLLVAVVSALLATSACAPTVVKTDPPRIPARSVLVLTGAGMVATSKDDPRYEQTWLKVSNTYADGLSEAINAAGLFSQVHVRKDVAESVESTFTKLVATERKDALLQVTVRHVRSSSDNTIYLKAEFLPLEFRQLSDGRRSVVPRSGLVRDYPVLSTTQPDMRKASLTELAKQFVKDLREQGLLQ